MKFKNFIKLGISIIREDTKIKEKNKLISDCFIKYNVAEEPS